MIAEHISIMDLLRQYGAYTSIVNNTVITLLLMVFMLGGREPYTIVDAQRMHDEPRTMSIFEEINAMMSYLLRGMHTS